MANLPALRDKTRAKEIIEQVQNAMIEELPNVVQALIESAKGFAVEGKDGKVFIQPPSVEAAKYIVDKILGKTPDTVVHEAGERLEDMVRRRREEMEQVKQIAAPSVDGEWTVVMDSGVVGGDARDEALRRLGE